MSSDNLLSPLVPHNIKPQTTQQQQQQPQRTKMKMLTGESSHQSQILDRAPPELKLTEHELDSAMNEFTRDENSYKTWSRRLVETTLRNYKWYFPQKGNENAPSLRKGWAYYEHITLARHLVGDNETGTTMERAEPGETAETELYSPWSTPESCLSEWGIGVGMYFTTLRMVGLILLMAGIINIANIVYYASGEYTSNHQYGVAVLLKGSALCTDQTWVPCPTCTQSQWSGNPRRFATWTNPNNPNDTMNFVERNLCLGAELPQGMVNWSSLLFLIASFVMLGLYQHLREIRFDEDKSTSTDYTVVVLNPPPDELDPEVWKDYFDQFGDKQVTVCTIILKNYELVDALVKRRRFRNNLQLCLPEVDLDDREALKKAIEEAKVLRDEEETCKSRCCGLLTRPFRVLNMCLEEDALLSKIDDLEGKIKDFQKQKYDVDRVFVTFETEEGQRNALAALTVGKIDVWKNKSRSVAPSALFRGKVLKVAQPPEPSAVRWMDLDVPVMVKFFQRFITLCILTGLIAAVGVIIKHVNETAGAFTAALIISFANFVIPQVCKILVLFEAHSAEGGLQASLYLKITAFRWVATAILTPLTTPFTSFLTGFSRDLLPKIYYLFLTELFLSPVLTVANIWGNIKMHYFAPRAKTQEAMNLLFQGTPYHLAERYTEFTKIIFLCFAFSALFPGAFFISSLTVFATYYTDKFCLMRIWARAPLVGTQVAIFSRRYFFTAALVAFAIMSSYAYSGFPYDNVCDVTTTESRQKYDSVKFGNDTVGDLLITEGTSVVRYCNQDFHDRAGVDFPARPSLQREGQIWMTPSQETLVNVYGWTSVAVLVVLMGSVFGQRIYTAFLSVFRGMYQPKGVDAKIDFSNVPEISAYVPQVKIAGFTFPFIACDIDDIDHTLIGWNDPNHSYDYHNLIFDVPYEGMRRRERSLLNTRNSDLSGDGGGRKRSSTSSEVPEQSTLRPIFSVVKHWPPAWTDGA